MQTSAQAYLLKAARRRRPSVWLKSLEPGYFRNCFNGKHLSREWQPGIREIRGLSYALSDAILWTGPGPLISQRAVELFERVAPGCAEYPFFSEIKGHPYFAINVLQGTDALDAHKSEVNRAASGEIVSIRSHVFKSGVALPPLFKLPDRLDCDLYCTPNVAASVVESQLKGFSFWDPAVEHMRDLFLGKDPNCVPGVGA